MYAPTHNILYRLFSEMVLIEAQLKTAISFFPLPNISC
jgi:hypothetical protein